MLSIDTNLPDTVLKELVGQHCSDYGEVEEVFILRQPAVRHDAVYALVKMATPESVLAVRRSFGDMMYGNTSVYIGLTPPRFH